MTFLLLALAGVLGFRYLSRTEVTTTSGLSKWAPAARDKIMLMLDSSSVELAALAEASVPVTAAVLYRVVKFSPLGAPASGAVQIARQQGLFVATNEGALEAIQSPKPEKVFVVVYADQDSRSMSDAGFRILFDPNEKG